MTSNSDPEQLSELQLLHKEYELILERTEDPEEQLRLRRILEELKTCILRMQSSAS